VVLGSRAGAVCHPDCTWSERYGHRSVALREDLPFIGQKGEDAHLTFAAWTLQGMYLEDALHAGSLSSLREFSVVPEQPREPEACALCAPREF